MGAAVVGAAVDGGDVAGGAVVGDVVLPLEFEPAGVVVAGTVDVTVVVEVGGGGGTAAPSGRQMTSPGWITVSTVAAFAANRSRNGTPAPSAMRTQ